jgi:3-oxoacyl-[acyl-carrier protein] reductase
MAGMFAGEWALVTGAASGIGRGIAEALAREDARLVLTDDDAERGAALACEIEAQFVPADLAEPGAAARVLDAANSASGGRLAILVHAACPRRNEAEHALAVSEASFDRMIAVGVRAGFVLARGAGLGMRAAGIRGRILIVTSLHAETPRNLPHYSATKAGQTMLVKELARAFGPAGIRVNAIAPGAIPGGGFAANVGALTPKIALGRVGTPADIAGMAVALLSDRFAAYVTGTTVVVDGGLALHNWIDPVG